MYKDVQRLSTTCELEGLPVNRVPAFMGLVSPYQVDQILGWICQCTVLRVQLVNEPRSLLV